MSRVLVALRLSLRENLRGPIWLLALGAAALAILMVLILPGETGVERAALGASVVLFIVRAAAGLGIALLFAGGLARDIERREVAPLLSTGLARWELLLGQLGAASILAAGLSLGLHALAGLTLEAAYGDDLGAIGHPSLTIESAAFSRSELRSGEPEGWVRGGGFARWRFEIEEGQLARGPLPLRYAFEAWSGRADSLAEAVQRHADFASCGFELKALDGEGHLIARRARGVLAGRATMKEEELPERFSTARVLEVTLSPAAPGDMLRADPGAIRLIAAGQGSLFGNLARSALLTAAAGAVCAAIAIVSGALFPGALALLFALALILGGQARPQISILTEAPAPISDSRAPLGEEAAAPRGPGPLVRAYLKGITALLPRLEDYDTGAQVLRGETVSLSRLSRGAPSSALYIAGAFALAALAFGRRELAA